MTTNDTPRITDVEWDALPPAVRDQLDPGSAPDFTAMFLGAIDMDLAEALLTLDGEGNLVRKPLDFASLTEDGDTLVVDATHRLVLHVDYDPDYSINDYDSDGRTEQYSHDYRDRNDRRPSDMDGAARKLSCGNSKGSAGDFIWWQPWDGFALLTVEEQRKEVERITELVRWGFKVVGLELQEQVTDSFDGEHWVEVDTQWLGGVDEIYPGLVEEQYDELMAQVGARS